MECSPLFTASRPILRQGEQGTAPPPRSRRVFSVEGVGGEACWYFKTREGSLIGAYRSELEAERGVADFVSFMVSAPADLRARFLQHLQEGNSVPTPPHST
jgi:hypothetical protein